MQRLAAYAIFIRKLRRAKEDSDQRSEVRHGESVLRRIRCQLGTFVSECMHRKRLMMRRERRLRPISFCDKSLISREPQRGDWNSALPDTQTLFSRPIPLSS